MHPICNISRNKLIILSTGILFCLPNIGYCQNPAGGALAGERYRVIISSDIGGSDDDDIQSMIHYFIYANLFDTEGLISSPPSKGRKKDILKAIDIYQKDYPRLKHYSPAYPSPGYLRSITKQGALTPAPKQGYSKPTEASQWIIKCAQKPDNRPIYVLVWGSITDIAQALHDKPSIKKKIRVYFIASWNRRMDANAFAYINKYHKDLWMIYCNSTFRGWYMGGKQNGDLSNHNFIEKYVKDHGALGRYFMSLRYDSLKMGDTPSVAYLLRGNPNNPTQQHWGGSFVPLKGRPHWWVDNPDKKWKEKDKPGAKTVNRWREQYLMDWAKRMALLQ